MSVPPPAPTEAPTNGWRTVTQVTWVLVLICMIVIAISSRTIGRPIWWLGPSTHRAPLYFFIVPIGIVVAPFIATRRYVALHGHVSLGCSILLLLTSLPNISSSPAICIATACVAVAALGGSIAVLVATAHYR